MDGRDSVIFIFHFHFFVVAVRLFAICPRYDSTSLLDVDDELLLIISNNYKNEILILTIPCCVDTFTFLNYDIR